MRAARLTRCSVGAAAGVAAAATAAVVAAAATAEVAGAAVPVSAFVGGTAGFAGTPKPALGRRKGRRELLSPTGVSIEAAADKERDTIPGSHPSRSGRQSRPLVHAKQLSPQEVRRRWPDGNFDVPVDLKGAAKTFFLRSPTPGMIVAGIFSVAAARVLLCGDAAPLGLADAAAVPVVAVGWSFQEWAIHKYLLHGLENWLGHDVHQAHHDKPFYHVCVDPPDLVAGWTLAAACVFKILLPLPLATTVLAAYMSMGLVYEWVHFIVHTRVVPRTRFGKGLKRHHTLHHLKDESCWLAFTAPPIDALLGTIPPRKERRSSPSPTGGARAGARAGAADVAAKRGRGGGLGRTKSRGGEP